MLSQYAAEEAVESKTLIHATNRWVEKALLYNAAINQGLKKDKNLINQKEGFYRDLLVSSYINIKTNRAVPVSKKDVSDYYKKHKKSFVRTGSEVVVKHFVFTTKKEALNIKNLLKRNIPGEKTQKAFKKHKSETRHLREGFVNKNLVGFVFKGAVGEVLGPKKHSGFYHVFEILKKHKAGSTRGLEFVYDEIYQRIYKQKEAHILEDVLDSLYASADVFISPGFFE